MVCPPHLGIGSLPVSLNQAGHQRLWYWRGWRVRYWFHPGPTDTPFHSPLLLIHGFGANLNQWRHNLPSLSQTRPVYALDLLGFGDAAKVPTLYGTDLWGSQVADFIDQVVGRSVLLVGHSLGALVALTVAHRYPQRVDRLAMVTLPIAAAREDLLASWVSNLALRIEAFMANPLLLRLLFSLVKRPWFLRWALRGIYLDPGWVDDELLSLFALPPQQRGAARALCYLVRSRSQANFSTSIKAMIRELSQPALLLWGEQDRVVPLGLSLGLDQLSPYLFTQRVARAGHCVYDEHAEQFNRFILEWVK
ncbi:MAG: alpha/beta fold hydrolase [Cyanobacteriota bacterium]|nr:alpha/beta fold hydrolase [Cyanobacteriota bacterium]